MEGQQFLFSLLLDQVFEIGKAIQLQEGSDVTIVATGHLVWEALEAAKVLHEQGISADVINIHTIKPLDDKAILDSVAKTGCIVTAEEHNHLGGLGESVARVLGFTTQHHKSLLRLMIPLESLGLLRN